MTDLREIPVSDIATTGLMFVKGKTYRYSWNGRLPEKVLLSVSGMEFAQPYTVVDLRPDTHTTFSLWPAVAVVVLIAAVGIWYWLLKRARQAG